MPKTPAVKPSATETAAAAPVRAAKSKTPRTAPVVEVASKPRVRTVKHSKAASPVVVETAAVESVVVEAPAPVILSAYEQISILAYGFWEARGDQPGSAEQDWLRAEQEFLARS